MTKKELIRSIKKELEKLSNEDRMLISVENLTKIANKCNCNIYCVMSVARYGTII